MGKKIAIIGAGPGGLTAAMILSHRGQDVHVFEKDDHVGGRNSRLTLHKDYHFDIGPTFLLMKDILEEVFTLSGAKISNELDLVRIDPMYELHFDGVTVPMTSNHVKMRKTITQLFPGEEKGFDEYLSHEEIRLKRMYPCLKADYGSPKSIFKNAKNLLKVLPHLSLGKSIYDVLGSYFRSEILKLCFTFQAKYLGMSPWNCPGFFAMLAYAEHKYGIYHTKGGLSEISQAMKRVAESNGARISLSSRIKKIITKNGTATGIQFADNSIENFDCIIINADFGTAMTQLFDPGDVAKYSDKKLNKKGFSCSTFMVYLALDKLYDLPFHSIYFAKEYRDQLQKIHNYQPIENTDFSFYVRNASVIDKTLAPEGHSGLYMLIPMSNLRSGETWDDTKNSQWFETALKMLETRVGLADIKNHIIAHETINPSDWQKRGIYLGATFNLAHSIDQMLYFRPHNQFECIKNCYLVGGGTHPGSGLPTIYESARITADLIEKSS